MSLNFLSASVVHFKMYPGQSFEVQSCCGFLCVGRSLMEMTVFCQHSELCTTGSGRDLGFFSSFRDLFVCLFDRQGYREGETEKEREIFHLVIFSPNGHNGWGWTMPKPEACSSI